MAGPPSLPLSILNDEDEFDREPAVKDLGFGIREVFRWTNEKGGQSATGEYFPCIYSLPAEPFQSKLLAENEALHISVAIRAVESVVIASLKLELPNELIHIIALFAARPRPFTQAMCDPDTGRHRKRTIYHPSECQFCHTPEARNSESDAMCGECSKAFNRCTACGGLRALRG